MNNICIPRPKLCLLTPRARRTQDRAAPRDRDILPRDRSTTHRSSLTSDPRLSHTDRHGISLPPEALRLPSLTHDGVSHINTRVLAHTNNVASPSRDRVDAATTLGAAAPYLSAAIYVCESHMCTYTTYIYVSTADARSSTLLFSARSLPLSSLSPCVCGHI